MKCFTILTLLGSIAVLAGCGRIDDRIIYQPTPSPVEPAASAPETAPPVQAAPDVIERRFVTQENQTDAVQSAVTWANKYEQVVEQNTELRDRHNQLFLENTRLKQQLETAKADLARTQKELGEANEFLQQMHTELNKWKADVLGFREEMLQAQKAQLEALSRVLQILGAEPVKPTAP